VHAHAPAVCSAMTTSHECMHAGTLARWHDAFSASLGCALDDTTSSKHCTAGSSCRWRGGWTITYPGGRTENVRRFAPKRALVDTNQAAGWAGGLGSALRVSQYTTAGTVGGCERRPSLLEFGVDSADCRVQSAGSFVWWRTSKVVDVWRRLRTHAAQKKKKSIDDGG
jgi:hypothetical protein